MSSPVPQASIATLTEEGGELTVQASADARCDERAITPPLSLQPCPSRGHVAGAAAAEGHAAAVPGLEPRPRLAAVRALRRPPALSLLLTLLLAVLVALTLPLALTPLPPVQGVLCVA